MKRYSVTFSPDLDPGIYVVTLYEIVGGGDLLQYEKLSPRFARRQQKCEKLDILGDFQTMCDRRPVFQVRTLSTFMRRTHFEKFGISKIETQMYTLVWPRKSLPNNQSLSH